MPEGLPKPSTFAKEGLKAGPTPVLPSLLRTTRNFADIASRCRWRSRRRSGNRQSRNVAKLKKVLKASGQSIRVLLLPPHGQWHAFDAGRYALADLVGIKHEELRTPTPEQPRDECWFRFYTAWKESCLQRLLRAGSGEHHHKNEVRRDTESPRWLVAPL